jgi:hypothetical protein
MVVITPGESMATPNYIDPVADGLRRTVQTITSLFESQLGLEPETSFGTRLIGKRYGVLAIATNAINTGGRIGTPGGYQEYQLNFNYQYVAVVASKVDGMSSVSYLNGETAFHAQTMQGFVDKLNDLVPAGNKVAEIRLQSMDTIMSQQVKEPYAYEITIVGSLSVLYFVRKDLYGVPTNRAIERDPVSFLG